MKKKLNLTEDIVRCMSSFNIVYGTNQDDIKNPYIGISNRKTLNFGGSNAIEDIALALGRVDEHIPGTEIDPDGMLFTEETTKYFCEVYEFIEENLYDLECLIHQFACKGGITPGVYQNDGTDSNIWEKIS